MENRGEISGVMADKIFGDVNIYKDINIKRKIISNMPKYIEILSEVVLKNPIPKGSTVPEEYKIEDKIKFNNLKKFSNIVNEYGNYYSICKQAFYSMGNITENSENRILRSIHEKYIELKRNLLYEYKGEKDEIDVVREYSDFFIQSISNKVEKQILDNAGEEQIFYEDVQICMPILICYAFAECKVLEVPK